MRVNVHLLMTIIVNNQLDLNSVEICVDETLQISRKSFQIKYFRNQLPQNLQNLTCKILGVQFKKADLA